MSSLPVAHEERPQHLWQSEGEQFVSDVFQKLVFEKGGKSGGPLRVTGRTDTALFATQSEQFFCTTGIASKSCEARILDPTIQVPRHDRIGETSPVAVPLFESLLPDGLDILEVALEELIGEQWRGRFGGDRAQAV